MKKIKIAYWICTILLTVAVGMGAFQEAINDPEGAKYITGLGYPGYLVPFLGVAKLMALIAILIPGFPRIKEWAYAGLVFDLTGATYSMIRKGISISDWWPMLIFFALVFASYFLYHKKNAGNPEHK